ncbi:MAG TPA: glycosyltransferase family 4 protein [Acidimicrobiales bacterium]|nr:glycosyltransferase family 4 protein [Acidimicrobiales bacterium]
MNKFLHRRGGSEAYMLELAALQRQAGHDVTFFSMQHPDNEPAPLEQHFPTYLELNPAPAGVAGKLKAAARMVWSSSSAAGMEKVIREFKPDVAHLHIIHHQLSPSILRPLAQHRVPSVMTLHDFKLACPTYHFLDKGKVCEACLGGKFQNAVLRRCKNGSLVESALLAGELTLHTYFRAYAPIQLFICPSRFIAAKMTEAGVFPDKLRVLPHFAQASGRGRTATLKKGLLFAGRLSVEKGVDLVVEALQWMDASTILDIAGEGPEQEKLEELASRVAPGRVRFLGRLSKVELQQHLDAAAVLAIPSRFYENQPMIILEAFASGVAVVGSDRGGVRELIEPGVDGLLVPPEDPRALATALNALLSDTDRAAAMGRAGRVKVERDYSIPGHLQGLDRLYAEAAELVTAAA